ncbi:hypothetical protein BD324DRAFT_639140 [Kockovaella imperatae]|uniref:Transglutaminase-like domain-containing protein n=1 Tax=Kockovaella imperatae TaxID=4999 RepID=A0A1Y1U6P1_9TREE|nr:hypothetical protein BD324DRAFT_639140 [Kockovaella imperatae]ORX33678.1 hypothetical protein BD324DRAFT_639140 [Kockovaella imperatae]
MAGASSPSDLLGDASLPVVAGFLARQRTAGIGVDLAVIQADLMSMTVEQKNLVRNGVDTLLHSHGHEVERFLSIPRTQPRAETEIARILKMLKPHTTAGNHLPNDPAGPNVDTVIPQFHHQVEDLMADPPFQPFGREDARVFAMARWFKGSFMQWVDPIKCPICRGTTKFQGIVEPTAEEQTDSAGRVELHTCEDLACGTSRRFARYSTDRKLFQTREGRCGEWAQLFYAFLRHAKIRSRYVWADTDHVWTEYWSPTLKHWVHADACEAAINQNMLYDKGWGKVLNLVIAVGADGFEDVTRAYVSDWDACLSRRYARGGNEKALRRVMAEMTITHRLTTLSQTDLKRLEETDSLQQAWMTDTVRRAKEAEWQQVGGRVSGPAEWRARRAELGQVVKPAYTVDRQYSSAISVLGDAIHTIDGVCLTSGPGHTSGVFLGVPHAQNANFCINVRFRITAPPGSGAADGIAIIFSPEPRLGESGFGMGYSGVGGQGDFAVEIDTYRTQDHADDPPTPHISVHSPPNAHHRHAIACMDSLPNLSDGKIHSVQLLYNGETRLLRGYLKLDGEDEVALWEAIIPEAPNEGKDWFVGITGSCGGLWQKQEVISWEMSTIHFA